MIEFNEICNVFIHNVSEDGKTLKMVEEKYQNIPRLNFFKNYHELSIKFKELGIFDDNDIKEVKDGINTLLTSESANKFSEFYTIIGGKSRSRKIRSRKIRSRKIRSRKYRSRKYRSRKYKSRKSRK